MNDNILLNGSIKNLFKKFVFPSVVAMLITGIQGMVDGLFVGNLLGPNAMASITISMPFVQVIIALSMIVSIGAQSYMGISLGANKIQDAKDGFKTSIIIISLIGSIITVIGFVFNKELSLILGANEVLVDDVSTYIRTIAIIVIPASLSFLFGFSTRMIEKPEKYFYGTILSLAINITLNYLFIYKFNMGVMGAGLATGLSYSSVLLIVIWDFFKKDSIINVIDGKFNKNTIYPIVYNGSSEGVNALSGAVNAFLFNMAFMNIAGELGVAGFTAISYIAQFGTIIMFGISDGIGPIISYNYGNKAFNRVNETLKYSFISITFIEIFVFVTLFFFAENLIEILIKGEYEVISLATFGSKIYAFAFFMNGFNIVFSGFFTSIGNARNSVIVASLRGIILIPLGLLTLPKFLGITGVWLSIPFAELITFVTGIVLIKKSNREMKNL